MAAAGYPLAEPARRIGFLQTPNAAGADGALVDLAGTNLQWRAGDAVETVASTTGDASFGNDLTAAFYPTVVDDSGQPALKQRRALAAGEQGKACVVTGVAR